MPRPCRAGAGLTSASLVAGMLGRGPQGTKQKQARDNREARDGTSQRRRRDPSSAGGPDRKVSVCSCRPKSSHRYGPRWRLVGRSGSTASASRSTLELGRCGSRCGSSCWSDSGWTRRPRARWWLGVRLPMGRRASLVTRKIRCRHGRRRIFPPGHLEVGGIFAPPFDHIWTRPAVGPHTIAARAIDGAGASTVSVPVRITVLPAPDLPPVVALVAPAWTAVQEVLFTPPSSRISAPLSVEPGPVFYRVRER